MIDNFKQVEPLFFFNNANGICFFVDIIGDNIACLNDSAPYRTVSAYFVRSIEHLHCLRDEIILLCEHLRARAFIDIGGYYINDINYSMLRSLAMENLSTDIDHRDPSYFLNKGIRLASPVRKRVRVSFFDEDVDKARELFKETYRGVTAVKAELPGVGIYSFVIDLKDLDELKKHFPNIVVSEDPILLYFPNSLDTKSA